MSGLFRCAGDILFDDNPPLPGQISNVQLKQFSETSNFLQYLKPLTPEHPYFFASIRALAQHSKITLGIAGPDIDNDAHPGHWNNTVGYHSNTGKCYTSHKGIANTMGEKFSVGDMFGVLVTYFGVHMSTVVFLKNGLPVATRYLFEEDHSKFLPTICLENGPIDLGILWPEAATGPPKYSQTNMLNWIKHVGVQYDLSKKCFFYDKKEAEVTIQSPQPLSKDFVHYEVVVQETSSSGEGPAVGIATCSPLKPAPTCLLLRDYFRWKADGKSVTVKTGQKVGFGIHYSPVARARPDFNDKEVQMVLCFVTLDMEIIFFKMMVQPEGGFYPLVILCREASKVSIDVESNNVFSDRESQSVLDKLYLEYHDDAMATVTQDVLEHEIDRSMLRMSEALEVVTDITKPFRVHLPAEKKGIHVMQFKLPLDERRHYFCLEIRKLNEDSVVALGIANSDFPLNKYPGKYKPSTGWVSRDGKMYFNEKFNSNIESARFGEGDTVGCDIDNFGDDLSVVLFIKNYRPVATRFLSIQDQSQFLPTISVCGNGYDVELDVYFQNRISSPPVFDISNLHHWCQPEDSEVDEETNIMYFKEHQKPIVIQCPYSMGTDLIPGSGKRNHLNETALNHFEIKVIDPFGEALGLHPPVIALTTASSQEAQRIQNSNFKIDYLRFFAIGDAEEAVNVGDLIGWGVYLPETQVNEKEKLVIGYLTINRKIVLTRVLYEPPGGLYPLVILPIDVNRVQFEFSGVHIRTHPLTDEVVDKLINDANALIEQEKKALSEGKDIADLNVDSSKLLRPLPVPGEEEQQAENKDSAKLARVVLQNKAFETIKGKARDQRLLNQQNPQSKSCSIL